MVTLFFSLNLQTILGKEKNPTGSGVLIGPTTVEVSTDAFELLLS